MTTSTAASGIWEPHDSAPARRREIRIPTGLAPRGVELVLTGTATAETTWSVHPLAGGAVEVRVLPRVRCRIRVSWRIPCANATAYWAPDDGHRGLPPFWRRPRTASLEKGAPAGCLVGAGDVTLCAFAVAEVVRPVQIRAGVVEETGEFGFWAEHEASADTGLVLRLDLGGRPFSRALADIAAWWQDRPDAAARPGGVPRAARQPAYSTWYAMQQHVDAQSVERQAELAAGLGCEAIIVDDGWHSDDRGRGYGYVGEWEPSPVSFPDISDHVAKVRGTGVAYMIWYALPFVGRHTALWERVQPYTLAYKEHMDAAVVDPRYPAVRDLLTANLARAVREWGADGIKIDFIDQFAVEDPPPPGPEADCATVNEGVRRLMAQLGASLPGDAMVELRQPYVSPGLWPYATMIRASDCPLSPAHNRQRTVDLRLVAGPLAVHADMIMWHPGESPEGVAVQLVNALFAVPQISVDLAAQTPEQTAVLRFWLAFVKEHAAVLQGGVFEPSRPDLLYPLVRALGEDTVIAARYAPVPVPVEPGRVLLLANADDSADVQLLVREPATATATVADCAGRPVDEQLVRLSRGVNMVRVPTGGLLRLTP
ncbi:hypothetical protein GCM10022226_39590 [Sphaerisporangium flaviroseum]|uniref:Alpha-galactosidase n=1 Tax=Sphaerisporangium flaviroseum TaxID=509199 RepID=A0ABP7IC99_9ACTN